MNATSSKTANFDDMLRRALIEDSKNYLSDLPTKEELENFHQFSPKFIQSMNQLFRTRQKHKRAIHRLVWAALFGIILCSFLLSQNETAKASLSAFIKEIFDIENTLIPTQEKEEPIPTLDSTHIPIPSFLPDGFKKTDEIFSESFVSFSYQNDTDDTIYMNYYPLSSQISVDNERFEWAATTINGHDAYFMTNEDGMEYMLTWRDSTRIYSLGYQGKSVLLDKDTFFQIAESIK